jgi:hypothetical protein
MIANTQLKLENVSERLGKVPRKALEVRFKEFHEENPLVYKKIVDISLMLRRRGVKKMGIALIFERIRWLHFLETFGEDPFKLNNDFKAEYARKAMKEFPELNGLFRLRALTSSKRQF